MNANCNTAPGKPSKPPKDGWGLRGKPECNYTSRVFNLARHYVRKLRIMEEETRIAVFNSKSAAAKDREFIEFFAKCDHKALIAKVNSRVKLSLQGYEDDLKLKRQRPFFSDQVHPFMKKMASGLTMRQMCPCGSLDYCSDPRVPKPLKES